MKIRRASIIGMALVLAAGTAASAQSPAYRAGPVGPGETLTFVEDAAHDMDWNSTDNGGGLLTGDGGLAIEGTAGQPDAGVLTDGAALSMAGGYWSVTASATTVPVCYANCDQSTIPPVLNVLDFNCFLNAFAGGSAYANCDQSTIAPVLNVLDFNCFLNRFAGGCP
jgi:hypothetical protein